VYHWTKSNGYTNLHSQDTSSLQYEILQELFKATQGSISIVGDPDQSSEFVLNKVLRKFRTYGFIRKYTVGEVQVGGMFWNCEILIL
jgi:hypothetical protein